MLSGPMGTYLLKEVGGNVPLSRFIGFWSVMVNSLFAYIGTELVCEYSGSVEWC